MSFTITIRLSTEALQGIEAIDFCRQHGMTESDNILSNASFQTCQVDERFARLWFGRNALHRTQDVQVDMLMPGEMVLRTTTSRHVVELEDLPDERVKELFIAGACWGHASCSSHEE